MDDEKEQPDESRVLTAIAAIVCAIGIACLIRTTQPTTDILALLFYMAGLGSFAGSAILLAIARYGQTQRR